MVADELINNGYGLMCHYLQREIQSTLINPKECVVNGSSHGELRDEGQQQCLPDLGRWWTLVASVAATQHGWWWTHERRGRLRVSLPVRKVSLPDTHSYRSRTERNGAKRNDIMRTRERGCECLPHHGWWWTHQRRGRVHVSLPVTNLQIWQRIKHISEPQRRCHYRLLAHTAQEQNGMHQNESKWTM
jgi:hypothetical protein